MSLCETRIRCIPTSLGIKEPRHFRKMFKLKRCHLYLYRSVHLTSKPTHPPHSHWNPPSQLTSKLIPSLRRNHRPDSHQTPSPHPPPTHISKGILPTPVEERGSKTAVHVSTARGKRQRFWPWVRPGTRTVNTYKGRSKNANIELLHKNRVGKRVVILDASKIVVFKAQGYPRRCELVQTAILRAGDR